MSVTNAFSTLFSPTSTISRFISCWLTVPRPQISPSPNMFRSSRNASRLGSPNILGSAVQASRYMIPFTLPERPPPKFFRGPTTSTLNAPDTSSLLSLTKRDSLHSAYDCQVNSRAVVINLLRVSQVSPVSLLVPSCPQFLVFFFSLPPANSTALVSTYIAIAMANRYETFRSFLQPLSQALTSVIFPPREISARRRVLPSDSYPLRLI